MSFSKSFAFSGFSDEDGTLEFIGRVEDWLKGNVTEKEAKYKIDEDFNSGKRNTFNPYVLKYLEVTFFEEESYNLFKLSFDKNELENFRLKMSKLDVIPITLTYDLTGQSGKLWTEVAQLQKNIESQIMEQLMVPPEKFYGVSLNKLLKLDAEL